MSHRRHAGRVLASIVLLTAMAVAAGPAGAVTRTITEFPIKSPANQPGDLTVGSDGNVWFVESHTDKIGHIVTKTGSINGFAIPQAASNPIGITTGKDGAIWFTEAAGNRIGRMVSGGKFTTFPIPQANTSPRGITEGPDGLLYFVEANRHMVVSFTPGAHTFTDVANLPGGSVPVRIAVGPDGNLWVTESGATTHGVARVALPAPHTITQVPLGTTTSLPSHVAAGPDGNVWVTEQGGHVDKIDPNTLTPTRIAVSGKPTGIAAGADGNMYVTASTKNTVNRITPATDLVKAFTIPTKASSPTGIVLGADGNIWFSENAGNKIGKLATAANHSSYVFVRDLGYTPKTQGVPLSVGSKNQPITVRWVFGGGASHSVTDASGMGLFDSTPQAPGTTFTHVFGSAGRFDYHSTVGGDTMTGTITVTPRASENADHLHITVTVATNMPGGASCNVQVKVPGGSGFVSAGSTSSNSLTYTPSNGHGTYRFQVQTTNGGGSSGFSPTVSVNFQ